MHKIANGGKSGERLDILDEFVLFFFKALVDLPFLDLGLPPMESREIEKRFRAPLRKAGIPEMDPPRPFKLPDPVRSPDAVRLLAARRPRRGGTLLSSLRLKSGRRFAPVEFKNTPS